LFREGQRVTDDAAIPPSKNPGITPSQASDPNLSKTRGTGKLIDPPAPKIISPTETTAAPAETAPVSAKVEDTKADKAAAPKADGAADVKKDAAALVQMGDVNTKRDISDKNIDEEVWGFVNADKNTLPHQRRRVEEAYPVNGWANPAGRFALSQDVNAKKDISDKNIDEEVWGFVNADKNTLPHQHRRVEEAYPANGWANPAGRFSLSQDVNTKKDISDKNIDEEVWGFVNADKNTLPHQHRRVEEAYPANGWANPAGRFTLGQRQDIAQPKVEANVYDFVNDKVESMPWVRNDDQYPANGGADNGWGNGAPRALFQQPNMQQPQRDIANKEVRPDVWVAVNKNVQPTANWRSAKPPSVGNFEPYKGAAPVPEFANPSWKEPAPAKEDAIQLGFLGNPERVNVMDPIAYQTRANRNTLDGGIQVRRTTFY